MDVVEKVIVPAEKEQASLGCDGELNGLRHDESTAALPRCLGGNIDDEVAAETKLLVLMHELGHAEDISRGVNYNHDDLTVDMVATEVYAHTFVLRYARRLDYRLALRDYIGNIEDQLISNNDAARLSAERVLNEVNIGDFKRAAKDRTDNEINRALEVSGRMKEFRTSQRSD